MSSWNTAALRSAVAKILVLITILGFLPSLVMPSKAQDADGGEADREIVLGTIPGRTTPTPSTLGTIPTRSPQATDRPDAPERDELVAPTRSPSVTRLPAPTREPCRTGEVYVGGVCFSTTPPACPICTTPIRHPGDGNAFTGMCWSNAAGQVSTSYTCPTPTPSPTPCPYGWYWEPAWKMCKPNPTPTPTPTPNCGANGYWEPVWQMCKCDAGYEWEPVWKMCKPKPTPTPTATPVYVCDYVAPPVGCSYVPGPNYDPRTQCGLILRCVTPTPTPTLTPTPTPTFTPTPTPTSKIDLEIFKSDYRNDINPGQQNTYTVTVTNNGPADANPAYISDDLPTAFYDPASVSWSCDKCIVKSGSGSATIRTTANIPAYSSVTLIVKATLRPIGQCACGYIENTAYVDAPYPFIDSNPNNNGYKDVTKVGNCTPIPTPTWTPYPTPSPTPAYRTDLEMVKTDGREEIRRGDWNTYTLTIRNNGPLDANPAYISDDVPTAFYDPATISWSCEKCIVKSGSGSATIRTTANIPAYSSITMTVSGMVRWDCSIDYIQNVAFVDAPYPLVDSNPNNNGYKDVTRIKATHPTWSPYPTWTPHPTWTPSPTPTWCPHGWVWNWPNHRCEPSWTPTPTTTPAYCTQDAKQCPDGSYVGRNPYDSCNFYACSPSYTPTPTPWYGNARVGIAKAAGTVSNRNDGSYSIPYTITVKNMGNATLTDIQVQENLTNAFPYPASYTLSDIAGHGGLSANGSFNGNSVRDLLNAGSSSLPAGATGTVSFTVRLWANSSSQRSFSNTASVSARSSSWNYAYDDSVNGYEVDPDGDGNANDDSSATWINLPWTSGGSCSGTMCSDIRVQIPSNAYCARYSTCSTSNWNNGYSCSTSTACTEFACNAGYHRVGDRCERDNVRNDNWNGRRDGGWRQGNNGWYRSNTPAPVRWTDYRRTQSVNPFSSMFVILVVPVQAYAVPAQPAFVGPSYWAW